MGFRYSVAAMLCSAIPVASCGGGEDPTAAAAADSRADSFLYFFSQIVWYLAPYLYHREVLSSLHTNCTSVVCRPIELASWSDFVRSTLSASTACSVDNNDHRSLLWCVRSRL